VLQSCPKEPFPSVIETPMLEPTQDIRGSPGFAQSLTQSLPSHFSTMIIVFFAVKFAALVVACHFPAFVDIAVETTTADPPLVQTFTLPLLDGRCETIATQFFTNGKCCAAGKRGVSLNLNREIDSINGYCRRLQFESSCGFNWPSPRLL